MASPNNLIISNIFEKSIKFLKVKRVYFLILLSLILFLPLFILAQTVSFDPPNIEAPRNGNFSLPLKINSVNNLFAVNFDLSFDPSLVEYVNTIEGDFLSQGCGTAMLVKETSPGRLVFGLTQLGASCGGVSGSGTVATLNFRSLNQDGTANLTFSNNSLCILNGTVCDYIVGTWDGATVTIGPAPDTVPPSVPSDFTATVISSSQINLSWIASTDDVGVADYRLERCQGSGCTDFAQIVSPAGTSYSDANLSSNTTFSYRVRAADAASNLSSYSSIASDTTQAGPADSDTTPPTISAISVSLITSNSATITWTTNEDTALLNSVLLSNLSPSTTYYFQIVSKDAAGNQAISGDNTFTTGQVPDTTAPSVPSNLAATVISSSQINLSWTASTDNVGVAGYRIYRDGAQIGTSATNSYFNTGLSPSTSYAYAVVAYDAAGNVSGQSSSASASTPPAADTTALVISLISASSVTYNSASISWTTNETSDSQIEYGTTVSYDSQTTLNTAMVTSHSQNLTGLSASTLYHYRVKSKDTAGNQAISGDNTFTTGQVPDTTAPSVPSNLAATVISSSQINLSWTASTDNVGVIGYRIYRGGTQIDTSTGNSYSNIGLSPSTTYTYTVAAYDAAGNVSGQSSPASASTPPAAVSIPPPPPISGGGDGGGGGWTSGPTRWVPGYERWVCEDRPTGRVCYTTWEPGHYE